MNTLLNSQALQQYRIESIDFEQIMALIDEESLKDVSVSFG